MDTNTEKNDDGDRIIELSDENFEKSINGKKAILVDFWATWCGP